MLQFEVTKRLDFTRFIETEEFIRFISQWRLVIPPKVIPKPPTPPPPPKKPLPWVDVDFRYSN